MVLVDLQYFPPGSFFYTSFKETNIYFFEYDRWQKMTFRNRCIIAGANNLIQLSIPVEGGREQKAFARDIRVSAEGPWQKLHWKSLHSAYNRSPFFDHYADELNSLFSSKQVWLQDWNRECLEWVKKKLDWPAGLIFLDSLDLLPGESPGDRALRDERSRLLPSTYTGFPAPVYPQVFESRMGFQANLSVLDLLFNTGPAAGQYLSAAKNDRSGSGI